MIFWRSVPPEYATFLCGEAPIVSLFDWGFNNRQIRIFGSIHNNSLPLGVVLTALLLVDTVVIDRMLLAVHILASLVKDVACVLEQIAYTDDDPRVEPQLDRTYRLTRRLVALLSCRGKEGFTCLVILVLVVKQ